MKFLFLKRPFLDLVRSGNKTQTIRPDNRAGLKPGESFRWNVNGGSPICRCEYVRQVPVCDLTDSDARADGFDDAAKLRDILLSTYPTLTPQTPLTLIGFSVVEPG